MSERGRVYNPIYTKEEWAVINPKNKDVMNDFLEEYRQRKKKKGTIDA